MLPLISTLGSVCVFGCILGSALAGCVQREKVSSDTLVIGIENELKNMDVRFASDANAVHVSKLVTQSLIQLNDKLLPESDLAESYELSKDGLRYTFKLPLDTWFHDGTRLTSQDVLYSFQQAAGPRSRISQNFLNVREFRAPDERTFVIEMKSPQPAFLVGEIPIIRIVPAHLGEDPNYGYHPVGSGAFKFKERKFRDLIFERFDRYVAFRDGKRAPLTSFKKLIVRSVEDPTTRFLSLLGGDIDLLFNALSPRRLNEVENNKRLQVVRRPGSTYQYLGLNFNNPKFKDRRVRLALSLAVNRDEIITHKLRGFAHKATSLIPPLSYFHNAQISAPEYDPERAKRLLKEAGAEGLSFELKSSTDRDALSVLQVITKQWERIGVRARIRPYEFATFFSDVQKGSFEAFSLRWTSVTEPDLMYKVFHSKETPPGRNRTFYNNAKVDRLLEATRAEMDLEKRKVLYHQIQEILAEDVAYISLWYPENVAVAQASIKNFVLHPTGTWMTFLDARKETGL